MASSLENITEWITHCNITYFSNNTYSFLWKNWTTKVLNNTSIVFSRFSLKGKLTERITLQCSNTQVGVNVRKETLFTSLWMRQRKLCICCILKMYNHFQTEVMHVGNSTSTSISKITGIFIRKWKMRFTNHTVTYIH